MGQQVTWGELGPRRRVAILVLGTVQLTLLVAALRDLRRRPSEQIRGSKRWWTAAVFVNFVGPIAYFLRGRRTPDTS